MNNHTNYPYAAGVYQGFIKSLQYNTHNIPGVEVVDQAKFESFIKSELERLGKNIQVHSQLTNLTYIFTWWLNKACHLTYPLPYLSYE